ncbi:uncharacterized protein LOC116413001 isoform X3 [Galleria mellonella]|uniref:Uncharacterized protein LOC116413001 isoform X3 n=1 Tax=Galleria mellonella TaxID=7137 RepID=A0ABM3MM01_GALME|nr:uncharacterized protein LOC116413001 isoform X3 [Galleria mellonella]
MLLCHLNGMYSRSHHRNHGRQNSDRPLVTTYIRQFIKLATDNLWFVYNKITNSYTRVTLATVFIVVLLSFLIPDISQKIHAKNDLKSMKKIINLMSQEVSRAEVACHAVADDICYLHCSMHDHAAYTNKDLRDLSMCTNCCMHSALPEPIQIEKKIGFFRRIFFPQRNTSHKVI